MKNSFKSTSEVKKKLLRYLLEDYQNFEYDEIERKELGFAKTLTNRRGSFYSDVGIHGFAQTIFEILDGSSTLIPTSCNLKLTDRIEVICSLCKELNVNPSLRKQVDLSALDILNQISEFLASEPYSLSDKSLISKEITGTIEELYKQISQLPLTLRAECFEGAIRKTGDLLAFLTPQTPECRVGQNVLAQYWSEYVGIIDHKIRGAIDEGRRDDKMKVINLFCQFMANEFDIKYNFQNDFPSEIIIEMFDDFADRMAKIDPRITTDIELWFAVTVDQVLPLSMHAWERLTRRNRALIKAGFLEDAENYLSYIMKNHLDTTPPTSEIAKRKHALLHTFIEKEMARLYPKKRARKHTICPPKGVAVELLSTTTHTQAPTRTDTGLPNRHNVEEALTPKFLN